MRFQLSHLFLLFSHIFIFTSPCIVSGQCQEYQKNALLLIFSNYSALPSWTSDGSDCCYWDGITCDNATGHVISLDVTYRSISGSINSSNLASLSSLRILNLSYNNFNSPIPPDLDSLSNLTHLNLSNSGFTGQIPIAIARISNLVSLDISTFFLSNPLSSLRLEDPSIQTLLQNLSGLRKLHLDGVNISSAVPEFLSDFTNLTSLRLSFCRLQGEFPAKIFQLPKLEVLDVWANPFLSGSFPELPGENALRTLVLSDTRFSGELPHSFGNLRHLNRLQIGGCEFSGSIPSTVRYISGIVHFDLSSNGFNGSIASLVNLTKLMHLDLSMNNFNGTIPSLESLTELVWLDLSWNTFSGPIPSLDSLRNATDIFLNYNNLTGTIPNSFGAGLHKLKLLDLQSNSLQGKIPSSLFTLPSLQTLLLSNNQLDGQLDEFANASLTLETVNLSDNQLQGQIPQSLFDLVGLKDLDLSSNKFIGTVQLLMFCNLKNLSSLRLSHNRLSVNTNVTNHSLPQFAILDLASCNLTGFPEFLKNQSAMQYLDLSNNNIHGEIPKWVWDIGSGSLSYLNLSHNSLTGLEQPHNPSWLNMLRILDLHSNQLEGSIPLLPPSVIVLDYSNNSFTSVIPSNFTNSLNFTVFFSISGNKISGDIPPSICNANYLQVLDLSNNNLSGSIPECLREISSVLNILNLRNNSFTGIIPEISSVSCRLRTLDLNGNRLEGHLPSSLANCSELEVLDIGNNWITGTFPYYTLSKLRVLVLRSNKFRGSISQPLNVSFPMLQIMDVSSNGFSGRLPENCFQSLKAMISGEEDEDPGLYHKIIRYRFLNLTNLYYQDMVTVTGKGREMVLLKILTIFTSVDLSYNSFEGEIPMAIGDLKLLHMLNLSHNGFLGQIPASLGNLTQLESLDLSQNNLSGVIPQQLTSLTFLSVLDLSHNQLNGSIPQDRQFSTFTNESFTGNLGLCGPPLSIKCVFSAPPPLVVEAVDSSASGFDWELIFIGMGFGGGLGMFAGPLLFWTEGRRWYNKHIDRVVLMIFPRGAFYYLDCEALRIEAEEQADQDCTENTTDWDGEEEECHQRFCVFCTQIDARWERVMHKECSCLDHSPPFSSPQSQKPEATPD